MIRVCARVQSGGKTMTEGDINMLRRSPGDTATREEENYGSAN